MEKIINNSSHSSCSSCCSDEALVEESVDHALIVKTSLSALFTLPLLLHMFLDVAILHSPIFQLIMTIPPLLIGLNHFGKSAIRSILARNANMDVLILIGFSSAFIYSLWGLVIGRGHEFLFFETAASIVTYVLIGNVIEHRATKNTSSAIREFLNLAPQTAKRIRKSGIAHTIEDIEVSQVQLNDQLLAATGDKIAADGVVIKSDALINESMITGESLPIEKSAGSQVFAGTLVEKGSVTYQATAIDGNTVFSEILKTIQEAKNAKPNIQRIGDKVSSIFVPTVLLLSALTLFISVTIIGSTLTDSILRAIAVLVVACPCAMGLATPTAVMVAVGRAAKSGILVKGGDIFERFTEIKEIIFDKTGTLTEGNFAIQELKLFDSSISQHEVFSIIKSLETHSNHPLAQSLLKELVDFPAANLSEIKEETGLGIKAKLSDGKIVLFGSYKTVDPHSIFGADVSDFDLFLSINYKLIAALKIADKVRTSSSKVVEFFQSRNINTALVSGDHINKCNQIAKEVKIPLVFGQQTPTDKLKIIQAEQQKNPIAFVGDGVNDVPSITAASVGVSFAKASSTAIASAGIIILSGNLDKIIDAYKLSLATVKVIKQNLFWAFFYNILMIPLAMFGVLSPGIAAMAMAVSDVFVIGNSLRLKILKIS
jgi:Cu+-exporting ATPase